MATLTETLTATLTAPSSTTEYEANLSDLKGSETFSEGETVENRKTVTFAKNDENVSKQKGNSDSTNIKSILKSKTDTSVPEMTVNVVSEVDAGLRYSTDSRIVKYSDILTLRALQS